MLTKLPLAISKMYSKMAFNHVSLRHEHELAQRIFKHLETSERTQGAAATGGAALVRMGRHTGPERDAHG